MNWPQRVLMVSPQYFDVEYAINPHMTNEKGELNKVDTEKAQQQWNELKATFESLGKEVIVLEGQPQLPDMVFCANQTFPFLQDGKLQIVLSRMGSTQRQPEVAFFKQWAEANNIPTLDEIEGQFEGMGDALWNYETEKVYGGYGFRTSKEVYTKLAEMIGRPITTFELTDDRFYHLDTCLAILNKNTAAYVEEAFTPEGLSTLKQEFANLIRVPLTEATEQLACNMCTPNGEDVILQRGAKQTVEQLSGAGFKVHEVETSEFIKSGGSVFCMKMLLF